MNLSIKMNKAIFKILVMCLTVRSICSQTAQKNTQGQGVKQSGKVQYQGQISSNVNQASETKKTPTASQSKESGPTITTWYEQTRNQPAQSIPSSWDSSWWYPQSSALTDEAFLKSLTGNLPQPSLRSHQPPSNSSPTQVLVQTETWVQPLPSVPASNPSSSAAPQPSWQTGNAQQQQPPPNPPPNVGTSLSWNQQSHYAFGQPAVHVQSQTHPVMRSWGSQQSQQAQAWQNTGSVPATQWAPHPQTQPSWYPSQQPETQWVQVPPPPPPSPAFQAPPTAQNHQPQVISHIPTSQSQWVSHNLTSSPSGLPVSQQGTYKPDLPYQQAGMGNTRDQVEGNQTKMIEAVQAVAVPQIPQDTNSGNSQKVIQIIPGSVTSQSQSSSEGQGQQNVQQGYQGQEQGSQGTGKPDSWTQGELVTTVKPNQMSNSTQWSSSTQWPQQQQQQQSLQSQHNNNQNQEQYNPNNQNWNTQSQQWSNQNQQPGASNQNQQQQHWQQWGGQTEQQQQQQQPLASGGETQQEQQTQQQRSTWGGPVQQQPSTWGGPAQQQSSTWDGQTQQHPSTWGGPAQQQSSTWGGPAQQQPSIWSGQTQQQPSIWSGQTQQQPSIWNGPAQQQPSTWGRQTQQQQYQQNAWSGSNQHQQSGAQQQWGGTSAQGQQAHQTQLSNNHQWTNTGQINMSTQGQMPSVGQHYNQPQGQHQGYISGQQSQLQTQQSQYNFILGGQGYNQGQWGQIAMATGGWAAVRSRQPSSVTYAVTHRGGSNYIEEFKLTAPRVQQILSRDYRRRLQVAITVDKNTGTFSLRARIGNMCYVGMVDNEILDLLTEVSNRVQQSTQPYIQAIDKLHVFKESEQLFMRDVRAVAGQYVARSCGHEPVIFRVVRDQKPDIYLGNTTLPGNTCPFGEPLRNGYSLYQCGVALCPMFYTCHARYHICCPNMPTSTRCVSLSLGLFCVVYRMGRPIID